MRRALLVGALMLQAAGASAQGPAAAAASITEADVTRRVGVIAHDSMMGRDTPSRGLELTAQYIAAEFKRLGLKPAGDSGSYFQRYPVTRTRLLAAASSVSFKAPDGRTFSLPFTSSAAILNGSPPSGPIEGPVAFLGGSNPATVPTADVKDHVVIWVLDFAKPIPASAQQMVGTLLSAGARGLVVVSNRDSAGFARRVADQLRERTSREGGGGGPFIVEIPTEGIVRNFPEAAEHIAAFRALTETKLDTPDGWTVTVVARDSVLERVMVPNVVGVLEGTDARLRGEYIVYSAHMDHDGVKSPPAGTTDSIWNGADDDASGTAGVVELAEAFAHRGARPRRSVMFMTVSGEEKGLWGSAHFSEHPTVPIGSIVANLNIDMIGRNWKDTIAVIGRDHSNLGATLDSVARRHPELRMTPVNDPWPQENLYFRSDHFNFARKGVPVLFFTSGLHDDYHQPTDSPDRIDAEKEARLLRLLFHTGRAIGDAAERPKWNPESYKRIVEGADVS